MEADVSTRTAASKAGLEKRKLPRALMGGSKVIRDYGEEFTPQYEGETNASYNARLKSTTLFNGFKDTVKTMVGKVLSKDVVLETNVPGSIVEHSANIDGQGRNLTAFVLDAFREAMVDGLSFIFVDFPPIISSNEGEQPFLSDQLAQGARPTSVLYLADQVLGVKHENRGGIEVLTEVRFHEDIIEPSGEWGEQHIEQIRVLRIGSYQLWRKVEDENRKDVWELYEEGTTSLPTIPVVPVYVNRTGYLQGEPPLDALAELNLEHWVSSSDQRKALTFARFAMMVFTGVEPGSISEVGPDKVICIREPNATYGKVESSGEGIVAGRLDLEALENKMQHVGMSINVETRGIITATTANIDSAEANAALLAAAGALEDSLDQMLQFFADYLSLPTGGNCKVNKEFGKRKSTATVTDLVTLYNTGLLDSKTVLSELQGRGDISEDLDLEEIQRRVRENPPTLLGGGEDNDAR